MRAIGCAVMRRAPSGSVDRRGGCEVARRAVSPPARLLGPPRFPHHSAVARSYRSCWPDNGVGVAPPPARRRPGEESRGRAHPPSEAGRLRLHSGTVETHMNRGPTERFREPGGPLRIVEPGVSGQEVLPPGGEGGAARQNGRQPGLGDEQRAGHGLEVAGIGSQKALGRGGGGPVIDPLGTSGASDLAAQSSQPPGRDQPFPRPASMAARTSASISWRTTRGRKRESGYCLWSLVS